MNFGQNLYNWFLSNAQSLVLMAIVVIGVEDCRVIKIGLHCILFVLQAYFYIRFLYFLNVDKS